MGFRTYARNITGPAVSDAAYAFRDYPSSDNWMLLERAMKAHQMSCYASDEDLELFLHDAPREETITSLLILFDSRMATLECQLERGHIRLIKALPEIRN